MKFSEPMMARISRWRETLLNILPSSTRRDGMENLEDYETNSTQSLTEGTSQSTPDYTELHGGSVPCPSCKGSGLIPKELESTLVALIPVNDERLKPKRTCLIVSFWVSLCFVVGSALIFLLMPRTVTLSTNRGPIEIVHVTGRDANHSSFIDFHFMNQINVTSGNYIPVDLVNITSIITSKFQPWSTDIVGHGLNKSFTETSPLILYRTTRELAFNNSVSLKGIIAWVYFLN
uniref:SEA domain-containing protein n=1 Tax=Meloidogyne hapla TaxID=6305 RepID=A0A1I8BPE8_MELHA